MTPFDGNEYRKRVLAAVLRRGGADTADAFELYDLPLEDAEQYSDAAVAERIDAVWGFWQRQRDHPKYGTLVELLVETHEERCGELLDAYRRGNLAIRVRAEREQRDAERFELLDQAIRRLVERHRGVPRDKIDGLVEIGALGGLSAAQVHARMRRHRIVDPAPAAAAPAPVRTSTISDHRRRQVRDLLDEFGRLNETPPPATLLTLLGLEPDAGAREIGPRAEAWRMRCRELPPLRIRAVADELLVHVRDLLEAGRPTLDAYLDAVAEDVADRLRPRVRAAVLVEDRLVADDHEHLLEEALALGLDHARGRRVLASIAAEMGVPVDSTPVSSAPPVGTRSAPGDRLWEEPLRAARAALRRGELLEARRLAEQARRSGGFAGTTPIRAVTDEIEDAVTEAELRWRAAATALSARRFVEAVEHLEYLCRTASDILSPTGAGRAEAELERARGEVATADAELERALAATDPAAALLAVLEKWPQHPGALAALASMPLEPPGAVRLARDRAGSVLVSWAPSGTCGVTYRVSRRAADGSWRVIGRTPVPWLEDGGVPVGPSLPDYAVVAVQPGRTSEESRSAAAAPAPAPAAAPAPAPAPAPAEVTAQRDRTGSVLVCWTGPRGAEFKVSRRTPDGRWQVVGRTRQLTLEDGGAPTTGALPQYSVTARVDGVSSAEARSVG